MNIRRMFAFVLIFALLLASLPALAQDEVIVTFWTTENQPERVERQEAIAAAFEEANPGVDVRVVPVEENEIDRLMVVNLASGTLPDLALHPIVLTAKWVNDGVLDVEATTSVIENLGVDTFNAGALALTGEEGSYGSIPSDGWGQLLLYRADLFEANGLAVPNSYEAILAGAQALHDPDNGFFGFCGPNAPDQTYTWQVFEHIALANGATFVDAEGNINWESAEMVEAMQFYVDLMNSAGQSESGWFWDQTRANYLAGNCGITIWSPFILDEMAGLRDAAFPSCAECEENPAFIAENTGLVGSISGYSNDVPAAWGGTFNIGITPDADPEALAFAEFWMSQAYLDALGIAPEGKFPMRQGDGENATAFIEGWAALDVGVDRRAPLSDFYSAEDLEIMVNGADNYYRMGISDGQALLAGAVGADFFIQENLVDAINGDITVEEALENIQIETEDIQFELEG